MASQRKGGPVVTNKPQTNMCLPNHQTLWALWQNYDNLKIGQDLTLVWIEWILIMSQNFCKNVH